MSTKLFSKLTPEQHKRLLGVIAILLVVTIYAANFVAIRYSVLRGLTFLNLTALRFSVAGLFMLPYFCRLDFRDLGGLGWKRALLLTCLAGSPYIVIFFLGISLAPASHGAVLNPGIIPSVVFLGTVFLGLQSFTLKQAVSLIAITLGVALVTASSFSLQGSVVFGDLLLLITGISWGLFTLLTKLWELKPLQITAVVSVISLLYLPPYLLFVYDGFEGISATHVLVQAFFQGIVLSVGTLYLATYAVQSLGAQTTSLFSPLVPILTTLIAVPLLREIPTPLQWIGIVLVVVGMLSATKINSEKSE
ncbi:MAG: DMT family transporter [Leptolyngbyaceae cyanobacterium SM1_1_3]|nr:DMT family transporter [Leptolyngbyaceae cyanobacterium SM1_1_3]NJO10704.1 DMT family transporter [Leptolyngbyaceae cyanobacterium SL_1_1]